MNWYIRSKWSYRSGMEIKYNRVWQLDTI